MIHGTDFTDCALCGAVTLNARTLQPRDDGPDEPKQYAEWAARRAEAIRDAAADHERVREERDAARRDLAAERNRREEADKALKALRGEVEWVAAGWQRSADFTAQTGAFNKKIVDVYDRHAARLRRVLAASETGSEQTTEEPTNA